ncbi:MAG: hypothetical protein PHC32_01570 [Candidatus Izemoplasmatales bacterium]|nr:hypothetical protein [Candidatus Izemoplasmatales bacterium]
MNQAMNAEMMKAFSSSIKIGLVATIDDNGEPHLSVLSTLQGKDEMTLMFGKFVEGLSKQYIIDRPKTGFLIMNPEKAFWFGKMKYKSYTKEGDDYVMYNNQPLYRYNTYFGINTVYYLDLIAISDKYILPMGQVIGNALKVLLHKNKFKRDESEPVLKPWAAKFTAKLDTLKFIAYIGDDGYPVIIPIIQSQSVGTSRLVIKNAPYTEWLSALKSQQKVAVLAFSMSMEDVLMKGTFQGFDVKGYGYIDIERVYNSMPPIHKYIYPLEKNSEVLFAEKDTIEL